MNLACRVEEFTETPDEYKAIISEFEDNFDVNQVMARNKKRGNKLEEK